MTGERRHILYCRDFQAAGLLGEDCCPGCHETTACEPKTTFPPHRDGKMPPLITLVYGHLCCATRRRAFTRREWATVLANTRHQSRR